MSDTQQIRVPFAGFYCSVHDQALDQGLETINTGDAGEPLEVLASDNVDWASVRLAYVQAYLGKLSEMLEIPMSFAGIVSPRFYNFETDAVYANIESEAIRSLHAKTMSDPDLATSFRDHVQAVLEPRSGFIPFYSNDLASWGELSEWDEVQISVLLDHHAASMGLDETEIAADLHEACYNAIWNAVIDMGKVPTIEEGTPAP